MTIRIEGNKIVGTVVKPNVQYLHGSPDVGGYAVKVTFDGTPLALIEQLIMDSAIIRSRKHFKTKEQVQALAKGISLQRYVSAALPQSAEALAADLNVEELSDAAVAALAAKLSDRIKAITGE